MKRILSIILFLPLYVFAVYHEGELTYINQYVSYKDKNMTILMGYDAKVYWNFKILMGEPVLYSTMIWNYDSIKVTSNESEYSSHNLPEKIVNKIRLYEFIIKADLEYKEENRNKVKRYIVGKVKFDTGIGTYPYEKIDLNSLFTISVKNTPQKYRSFNSNGSPSWDKIFDSQNKNDDGTNRETEKKIKQFFSQKKVWFKESEIISAKADFSPLVAYVNKLMKKEKKEKDEFQIEDNFFEDIDKLDEDSQKDSVEDDFLVNLEDNASNRVPSVRTRQDRENINNIQDLEYQISAKKLDLKSQNYKTTYLNRMKKCNTSKPKPPKSKFKCVENHGCGLIIWYDNDWSEAKKERHRSKIRKECEKERIKGCKQQKKQWEEDKKTYSQRLGSWETESNKCKADATNIYEKKLKQLLQEQKEIEDFTDELKF